MKILQFRFFIKLTKVLALLILTLFLSNTFIKAQKPQDPTPAEMVKPFEKNATDTQDKVGNYLETKYTGIVKPCKIENFGYYKKNKLVSRLTTVPSLIRDRFVMTDLVLSQDRVSIAKVFALILPSPDISKFNWTNTDSFLFYKTDFAANPSNLLPDGESSLIYLHNCTTVISAAAKVNADVNIPFAALKAALDAQANDSTITTMALVSGSFKSPFYKAYKDQLTREEKLAALFNLWNWYSLNKEAAARTNYIVTSFNGISANTLIDKNKSASGGISFSGASSVPFVQVDAEAAANFKLATNIEIKEFSTAAFYRTKTPRDDTDNIASIDGKVPDITTITAPTYQEIIDELGTYSTSTNFQGDYLTTGKTSLHTQSIAGIPDILCHDDRWRLKNSTNSGKGSFRLKVEKGNVLPQNANIKTCNFNIEYTPDSNEIKTDAGVTLNFTLETDRDIKGKKVVLKTTPVFYRTKNNINLQNSGYKKLFATVADPDNPGDTIIGWNPVLQFIESDTIDFGIAPSLSTPKLVCTSGKNYTLDFLPLLFDSAQKKVTLRVQHTVLTTENLDIRSTDSYDSCTVSGNLKFSRLAGLAPIEIPFSTEIRFPPIKKVEAVLEVKPATVTPVPSPSPTSSPN